MFAKVSRDRVLFITDEPLPLSNVVDCCFNVRKKSECLIEKGFDSDYFEDWKWIEIFKTQIVPEFLIRNLPLGFLGVWNPTQFIPRNAQLKGEYHFYFPGTLRLLQRCPFVTYKEGYNRNLIVLVHSTHQICACPSRAKGLKSFH